MHVLIIGAAGMIGRKLTQRLARDGRLGESEIAALSLFDAALPEKPARQWHASPRAAVGFLVPAATMESCRDGRAPRTHHAGTFAVKARRART